MSEKQFERLMVHLEWIIVALWVMAAVSVVSLTCTAVVYFNAIR